MRSVRMKFTYVGTRWAGGPVWPGFNEVMETSDEEATQLVTQGNAVYLEDEPEPVVPGWNPLRKWTDNYDPALDPDNRREEDPELTKYEVDEVEAAGPKRPYTNANRDAWVEYAVSVATAAGEDPEVVRRMTRVDLISKYGASL